MGLPENTLGHALGRTAHLHGFDVGGRAVVTSVADADSTYVLQRYRDVHDILHAVFGFPVTVAGEISLKAFEFAQTKIPMTAAASVGGMLRSEESFLETYDYVKFGIELSNACTQSVLAAPWETDLGDDVSEVLKGRLGIDEEVFEGLFQKYPKVMSLRFQNTNRRDELIDHYRRAAETAKNHGKDASTYVRAASEL